MKLVILLISIFLAYSLKAKLSYESSDLLKDDLFIDGINNGQTGKKLTYNQFQQKTLNKDYSSNGYINLDDMNESIQKPKDNSQFGNQFRFLRGYSAGPQRDAIFKEKLGLSNGVVLFGRRRTCNFATKGLASDPKIDEEIKKIEFN